MGPPALGTAAKVPSDLGIRRSFHRVGYPKVSSHYLLTRLHLPALPYRPETHDATDAPRLWYPVRSGGYSSWTAPECRPLGGAIAPSPLEA